ncbi:hypothetical protein [[Mycobacterium] burgundiense]|uniref:Uncharacterized protein n=1 Tax=[Mycobacterium] burgundiense TaxID=3064286 RepID=A0ABM9M1H0_9MYCO|nr:hypothetical protein [Mycolicibacterium sp. MU0053]CAJ1508486.1 hypothetical protein MU0053_003863 [Mycolicibacterium sp. MU0053]
MSENLHMPTEAHRKAPWRDPLSIGWQAHRRLLLLRLHWHDSSSRRRDGAQTTVWRHRIGGHQR